MDEIWERAVQTALDGVSDCASARTLTLDGAVKCVHGRLPPPSLLEKFHNLQHLSIANTGVSSLDQFPRLRNLQKLILSDNRIASGLEHLVAADLESLRDLDLSNNRIQYIEDLAPLAQLRLVSLDLYECPVTRVKDYRARVFGLIKSLKYLDKMDAEENERPESDDEDDEEEEDEDPGSGEIDGEERSYGLNSGHSSGGEGIVDVDEDEESDAEEEIEISRRENGLHHQSNGFRVVVTGEQGREEDFEEEADDDRDDDDDDDDESAEEIYEEGEEEDVVEVHEIEDSDDEDEDEYEEDDEDEVDEVEEVDNEDVDFSEPASTGRLMSTEGEIDGHEQGEDDGVEDDNGVTGEEGQGFDQDCDFEDDGGDEEEDNGAGYLVQRVTQDVENAEEGNDDDDDDDDEVEVEDEEEEDDDDLGEVQVMQQQQQQQQQQQPPCSPQPKRKREDDSRDEDDEGASRSSKKMH